MSPTDAVKTLVWGVHMCVYSGGIVAFQRYVLHLAKGQISNLHVSECGDG